MKLKLYNVCLKFSYNLIKQKNFFNIRIRVQCVHYKVFMYYICRNHIQYTNLF